MTVTALDELTDVARADVYRRGILAGQLRRSLGGTEFSYLQDYLDSGGPAVATTLPTTGEPQFAPAGAVPPFFAGLLPEGRRLSSLRRAVGTSADDELSLLLAVGSDPVGDVQVVPEGDPPSRAETLVQVQQSWSEVRFADVLDRAGVVDPVGLPGVQEKASARMISMPLRRAGERYILKVDPPEYPLLVENEAYFLDLARRCGLEAAHADVVTDAEGRSGLLVTRFDRLAQPGGESLALAMEDACQVLGRWPADKYRASYEEVTSALAAVCSAPTVAVRELFGQVCFAWLTGNGDAHAKNLAVVTTPDGEWRVAPAYDLPSTVPYGDNSMALRMGGRRLGLSRRKLLEFAAVLGLSERSGARVLDELISATAVVDSELRDGALPFPQKVTADLIAELRFRRTQAGSGGENPDG